MRVATISFPRDERNGDVFSAVSESWMTAYLLEWPRPVPPAVNRMTKLLQYMYDL